MSYEATNQTKPASAILYKTTASAILPCLGHIKIQKFNFGSFQIQQHNQQHKLQHEQNIYIYIYIHLNFIFIYLNIYLSGYYLYFMVNLHLNLSFMK